MCGDKFFFLKTHVLFNKIPYTSYKEHTETPRLNRCTFLLLFGARTMYRDLLRSVKRERKRWGCMDGEEEGRVLVFLLSIDLVRKGVW